MRLARGRGFTLIEVLVAFTVMVLVFAVGLRIMSNGLRAGTRSSEYTRAVLLGRSRLATLAAQPDLSVSRDAGRFDQDFAWSTTLAPYPPADQEIGARGRVMPLLATVEVSWGHGVARREITLNALILSTRK